MKKYKDLKILKKAQSVCIIAHCEPDVDALASLVVMQKFVKDYFKISTVDIFAECKSFPDNYSPLLKGSLLNVEPSLYDTAIVLDCPNVQRIGKYDKIFNGAKQKIVIDHHATNQYFGDYNIVEVVSSTCEIVYRILKEYNYKLPLDYYDNIYAGIITDTANFSVGEMNKDTFKIVSEIYPYINQLDIYDNYFSNNTLKNMQVLARAIENVGQYNNGATIFSYITKSQAAELNLIYEDYTGIINRLATISGVKLVCFVYPKDNCYYVSMRAKRGLDVATIAKKYGGGGHVGASAFLSNESLENIQDTINKEFSNALK